MVSNVNLSAQKLWAYCSLIICIKNYTFKLKKCNNSCVDDRVLKQNDKIKKYVKWRKIY